MLQSTMHTLPFAWTVADSLGWIVRALTEGVQEARGLVEVVMASMESFFALGEQAALREKVASTAGHSRQRFAAAE